MEQGIQNVRERNKPELLAEYQIPTIGTVRLFDNTQAGIEAQMYHGDYSSLRFKDKANVIPVVDALQTPEELTRATNQAIAQILLTRRKELLEELAQIESVDSGVVNGSFSDNWMEKYRQNKTQETGAQIR